MKLRYDAKFRCIALRYSGISLFSSASAFRLRLSRKLGHEICDRIRERWSIRGYNLVAAFIRCRMKRNTVIESLKSVPVRESSLI